MFYRRFFGPLFFVLVVGGLIALGYALAGGGAAIGPIGPGLGTVLLVIVGLWFLSFIFGGIFRFGMMRRWRRHGGPQHGGWGHRGYWGHKGGWGHHKGRIPSGKGYWEWREGEPDAEEADVDASAKDAPAGV